MDFVGMGLLVALFVVNALAIDFIYNEKYKRAGFLNIAALCLTVAGSLTVVSNFSLTKSLKTLIISILLSFFIVKFVKIFVLIWANMCYNRHRR